MAPSWTTTTLLIILLHTSAASTTAGGGSTTQPKTTGLHITTITKRETLTSPHNVTEPATATTTPHNVTEHTTAATTPHNVTEPTTAATTPHSVTEPTTAATTPHSVTGTTMAGSNATVSTVQSTTQPAPTSVYMQMRITNQVFSILLNDPTSKPFKDLAANIEKMFDEIYNCSNCPTRTTYIGVIILAFSSGSVIADTEAKFKEPLTAEKAKAILDEKLSSSGNEISGLQVTDVRASDTPISSGASSAAVPGWGIALLVLASLILLVAIIFLIIMLILLCRKRSSGYMDVFATRGSYHSMNDYTPYQTHGRFVAPTKHESSGNGTKNQYSYSNQGLETNNL